MLLHRKLYRYLKPFLFCCLVLVSLDVIFMALKKHSFTKKFLDTFKSKRSEVINKVTNFKITKPNSNIKIADNYDLRVIVLTFNRPESLNRCLSSLKKAEYYGDKIVIDIWLDRSKDKHEKIHEESYRVASKFTFPHGEVKVHNHTRHVGIYGQWLTTWEVHRVEKEIAIFVEDDITVSKYFYKWLKAAHQKYDRYPNVNGYATQGVSMRHSGAPGPLKGPSEHVCFLYPVLGTWGFSPNRKNWLKFIEWYRTASQDASFQPLVPGILPSKWYANFVKQGRTDRMWSIWHIYFAWKHNEYTLYPNLPGRRGLSVNWKEKGLNYGKSNAKADPLLEKWEDRFVKFPDKPPVLDYSGAVVIH